MHVVQPQLEPGRLALLAGRLVELGGNLRDHFLDPRRVDAAVGHQLLDGLLGDGPPVRVEARQDDRLGGVVDDQLHAGGVLQGADVAPLAADYASLEVVAGQVDHGDGRLDGVLGRAALDGLRDDLARLLCGRFARLVLQPLHQVRGVPARIRLDLADQHVLRLVGGHPGHPLQLPLPLRAQLLVAFGACGRGRLPLAQRRLAPANLLVLLRGGGDALGQRPVAVFLRAPAHRQRLLVRGRPLAYLAGLFLGLLAQRVRLFLGREQQFLLLRLGVAQQALGVVPGAAGDLPRGIPPRGEPDEEQEEARQEGDGGGGDAGCELAHVSRPDGLTGSRSTSAECRTRSGTVRAGARRGQWCSAKGPRVAVWGGRMNLPRQGEPIRNPCFRLPRAEACTPQGITALIVIALVQAIPRTITNKAGINP